MAAAKVVRIGNHKARLGHALRAIRARMGLTLAETGARTGDIEVLAR